MQRREHHAHLRHVGLDQLLDGHELKIHRADGHAEEGGDGALRTRHRVEVEDDALDARVERAGGAGEEGADEQHDPDLLAVALLRARRVGHLVRQHVLVALLDQPRRQDQPQQQHVHHEPPRAHEDDVQRVRRHGVEGAARREAVGRQRHLVRGEVGHQRDQQVEHERDAEDAPPLALLLRQLLLLRRVAAADRARGLVVEDRVLILLERREALLGLRLRVGAHRWQRRCSPRRSTAVAAALSARTDEIAAAPWRCWPSQLLPRLCALTGAGKRSSGSATP